MTNGENNNRLNAVEFIWYAESDRWIYIERWSSGFIGLNFMQGDDYLEFRDSFGQMDYSLSKFYEDMEFELSYYKDTLVELEFIDKVMSIYLSSNLNK